MKHLKNIELNEAASRKELTAFFEGLMKNLSWLPLDRKEAQHIFKQATMKMIVREALDYAIKNDGDRFDDMDRKLYKDNKDYFVNILTNNLLK